MKQKSSARALAEEYLILTLATALLVVGVYVFKFPNHFSFGGVTGIAVLLEQFVPLSASTLTLIMNLLLLIVGFLFIGKDFGVKTVYVSLLSSVGLELLERSDLLLVCGTTLSKGMKGEITHAAKLGIPIQVFDDDLYVEVRKLVTQTGASKKLVELNREHSVLGLGKELVVPTQGGG